MTREKYLERYRKNESEYKTSVVEWDCEWNIIGEYYGELYQVLEQIHYKKGNHYSFGRMKYEIYGDKKDNHFGVKVKNEFSNKTSAEICTTILLKKYIDFFEKDDCFSLMQFYNIGYVYRKNIYKLKKRKKINKKAFIKAKDEYINSRKRIRRIFDLKECRGISGIYIMVLEEYRGIYIGQSEDIGKRIRQHWSAKSFNSYGIDMYRALDTTEIYIIEELEGKSLDFQEYANIKEIDSKYLINKLAFNLFTQDEEIYKDADSMLVEKRGRDRMEKEMLEYRKIDISSVFEGDYNKEK